MSSFSNKAYSRNFLKNSKVILRNIFCDTSVNFLCTYPLLYTAGMCDVTYVVVYKIYLHGKCFLSTLYNNISSLTPPQSTLLFVLSDPGSHTYATSQSSSLRTDQHHTSCGNTTFSVFAFAANTHDTAIAFLSKANAVSALLPVDWAGMQMDLVSPLKCH